MTSTIRVACIATAFVALAGGPATAQAQGADKQTDTELSDVSAGPAGDPACGVTIADRPAAPGTAAREVPATEAWLASEETQALLQVGNDAAATDSSILTVVADPGTETGYAIVDPTASRSAVAVDGLMTRAGCASRAELDADLEAVKKTAPTADLRGGGVSFSVDYAAGEIVISGSAETATAVAEQSGATRTRVDVAEVNADLSRNSDANPHYGGANVWLWNQGQVEGECTTGFSAFNGFGVRMTVTAAHCGQYPMQGWSGGNLEGVIYPAAGYENWFPGNWYAHDIAALYYPGQSYSNGLYVDPCCPSTRFVNSYGDASVGQYVCTNGAITLAVCGIHVDQINVFACHFDALRGRNICTQDLTKITKTGNLIAQPGDSGGTIYQQSGGSGAKINGTIKAGDGQAIGPGSDSILIQEVSSIVAEGLTPATY